MEIFFSNLKWMSENIGLALLGVLSCFLFLKTKKLFFKTIFFIFWLLFVPNTIYLFTDILYLPAQILKVSILYQVGLVIQYLILIILGFITYISSVYPIEVFFEKNKKDKKLTLVFIFLFNFLIAFAVALGKIQRTHSWYIFNDPLRVFTDFYKSLSSFEIMFFVFIFGLVLNILYFYVLRSFKRELNRIFKSFM